MPEDLATRTKWAKQRLAHKTLWDKPRPRNGVVKIQHFDAQGNLVAAPEPTLVQRLQDMHARSVGRKIDGDHYRSGFSPYMRHAR